MILQVELEEPVGWRVVVSAGLCVGRCSAMLRMPLRGSPTAATALANKKRVCHTASTLASQ
ncbi:hypothetical protein ACFL6U_25470, partial [Planctomycetota bacterium]